MRIRLPSGCTGRPVAIERNTLGFMRVAARFDEYTHHAARHGKS
jgi:hypothetical protein